METIPLEFRFKENRDYVHGTDVYNQMLERIKAIHPNSMFKNIKLAIHYVASKHCNMILGDIGEIFKRPNDIFVDLAITADNKKLVAFLVETGQPVKDRYEYDESRIEALCRIIGEKIIITGNSGYSPIEAAVSMTKQLHYKLFPVNQINQGKWFFTRLELLRPLESVDSDRLAIIFKHNFNNRLTKSGLIADGESIGHIYFSLVKR